MKISKYIKASLIALFAVGLLAACGTSDKKDEKVEEPKETTKEDKGKQNTVDKTDQVSSDEEISKQIEEEQGVSRVSLVVTEDAGGFVIVDINVENDVEKEAAQKIADKYIEILKKKYKDLSIDIQIHQGDTLLAQKTIEK